MFDINDSGRLFEVIWWETDKTIKERKTNMDEKTKEALKSVYNNLTDEQKEKAKACKTYEEIMNFAGEEGIELPDDLVDSVSGGYIVEDGEDVIIWGVEDPSQSSSSSGC